MSSLLPNRSVFLEELTLHVEQQAGSARHLALIIVHLARLRDINRTYGFHIGDEMVSQSTKRMRSILREKDRLYQLSDSEFAIVLPDLINVSIVQLAVTRLAEVNREYIHCGDARFSADAIFGIAIFPNDAKTALDLIHCTQMALHIAERKGVTSATYCLEAHGETSYALLIENLLHVAIDNDELSVAYQPKIDLQTGKVCGMEALTRWNSGEYGAINPQVFVGVAEKSGLIVQLTRWMFNTALRQCKPLLARTPHLKLAINLSAVLLPDPHLVDIVMRSIHTWDFPAGNLILELTESAVMKDPDSSRSTIKLLRNEGIIVSIDDFGTGYSSLAYLRRLPVGELKIDKSFILGMAENKEDCSIVNAVISLAHTFDLEVVAEGIENRETLTSLKQMGCDTGQGYYIAKPMPMSQFLKWLGETQGNFNVNGT